MDYHSNEEVASVMLFDVRVSESELMVFESCIEYVVNNCPESDLYHLTGCETKEELNGFREDIIDIIKKHVLKEFMPPKYTDSLE